MKFTLILLTGLSFSLAFPTDFPEDADPTQTDFAPTGFPETAETLPFTPMEKEDLTTTVSETILTSPAPRVDSTTLMTTTKSLKTTNAKPTTRQEEPKEDSTKQRPAKPGSAKQSNIVTSASTPGRSVAPTEKRNMFEDEAPRTSGGKAEKLSDFLKRRKEERFLATTEADPFAAFFSKATTTTRPPFREREETKEPTTSSKAQESFSSSGRSFSAPSKNRPGNRRNAGVGRSGQSSTELSTTTTTTPRPTPTKTARNRFTGFPRRGATSTTPDTSVIDKPQPVVESSTSPRTSSKRPSAFRPVPNSISRKREQAPVAASNPDQVVETNAEAPEVPRTTTRRGNTPRVRGNRL